MKVGIVFGAFDLLHVGHINFLRKCKKSCDYLIVGLHVDPSQERRIKNRPVESVFERFVKLKSCKTVDQVIPYETENDLRNILIFCEPNVRFLGEDYAKQDPSESNKITEENLVPIEYIKSIPVHTRDIRSRL